MKLGLGNKIIEVFDKLLKYGRKTVMNALQVANYWQSCCRRLEHTGNVIIPECYLVVNAIDYSTKWMICVALCFTLNY